jgi:hypothetical protein
MDLNNAGRDIHVTAAQLYRLLVHLAKSAEQTTPVMADHLYIAAKACETLSERGAQVVDIANQPH